MLWVGALFCAAPAEAASLHVAGALESFAWEPGTKAYMVPPDTGLTFEAEGPANVLLELRAQSRGKRVIIDIIRDDKFRSRNATKLRRVGGGRRGFRFVTLLALKIPKGKHQYAVRVQGVEPALIARITRAFLRPFAARAEEDLAGPTPEEAALALAKNPEAETANDEATGEQTIKQSTSALDNALFGGDDIEDSGSDDANGGDESTADDGPVSFDDGTSGDATEVRIALSEDVLSIGGRVYQRFVSSAARRESTRNLHLASPNTTDVYLDARPSDRIRAYVQARTLYDPTSITKDPFGGDAKQLQVKLDQLWIKTDIGRVVFITVGKQHLKWGTGRFWSPVDVLNTEHRNPLEIVDERTGIDLLKLHMPFESLGWNLYAVAKFDGIDTARKVTGAARAEMVFGPSEIAFSAAGREGERPRFGFDMSAGVWLLELRGEVLLQQGGDRSFYRGTFDPQTLTLPTEYHRRDEWLAQYVAGAELSFKYSDADSIYLGMEYFHNDGGYRRVALYPFLALKGELTPLYVGRDYAAAYMMLPNPGSWNDSNFMLTGVGNLSDRSYLARFEQRVTLLSYLEANWWAQVHFGQRGELRYGLDLPASPLYPQLPDGVSVRAPLWTLGVGLLVNI